MNNKSRIVPVLLADGTEIKVEATLLGGESEVAISDIFAFESITKSIEGIADQLLKAIKTAKPSKATIEFGIEIGIESGKITSFLVKGTGSANMKITLEWAEKDK